MAPPSSQGNMIASREQLDVQTLLRRMEMRIVFSVTYGCHVLGNVHWKVSSRKFTVAPVIFFANGILIDLLSPYRLASAFCYSYVGAI
jgi:hypothetical protein